MTDKIDKNKSFFLKGSNEVGILLLHGWTSPNEELFGLAEYLNSLGHTVSVPLLLGHGTKPEDLEHVTWKDWLAQSREELKKLERHCDRVFVGGISMGASLAMLLAKDKKVAGVFTMGAAMKYRFHTIVKMALFFMGLTKKYRRKYYPPWVREYMKDRKVYMYYPIESAKEIVRLSDATRRFLPQIAKPILIMQSTTDHMVPRKSPRMIFDGVKSETKEIFWVKDVYHVFAKERRVWEKIGEFIENNVKCQSSNVKS